MIEISIKSDLQDFEQKAEKLLAETVNEIQAEFERNKLNSQVQKIGFRVPKLNPNLPKISRNILKINKVK